MCLHVLTKDRTYNIVGFKDNEMQREWLTTLKNILRTYLVKKSAKKLLKDHTSKLRQMSIFSLEKYLELDLEEEFSKMPGYVPKSKYLKQKQKEPQENSGKSPVIGRSLSAPPEVDPKVKRDPDKRYWK